MTRLIVHRPDSSESATPDTVFGGRPSAPQGLLEWPVCKSCKGNMQFLGQLRPNEAERLLLLFMCQNEPGLCDEWDPNGGGNKVLTVATASLELVEPPTLGKVMRQTRYGARFIEHIETDYEASRGAWAKSNGVSPREVLGQVGGAPAWIQNEEVPVCASCGRPMQFVAQLEQGPDRTTEMNFGGGGCAYVFYCSCAHDNAKMLWQC